MAVTRTGDRKSSTFWGQILGDLRSEATERMSVMSAMQDEMTSCGLKNVPVTPDAHLLLTEVGMRQYTRLIATVEECDAVTMDVLRSIHGFKVRCILIAHFTGDGGNECFGRKPYPIRHMGDFLLRAPLRRAVCVLSLIHI